MKKSPCSRDYGYLIEGQSGSLPLTEIGETLRRGRVNSVQRDPTREALAVSPSHGVPCSGCDGCRPRGCCASSLRKRRSGGRRSPAARWVGVVGRRGHKARQRPEDALLIEPTTWCFPGATTMANACRRQRLRKGSRSSVREYQGRPVQEAVVSSHQTCGQFAVWNPLWHAIPSEGRFDPYDRRFFVPLEDAILKLRTPGGPASPGIGATPPAGAGTLRRTAHQGDPGVLHPSRTRTRSGRGVEIPGKEQGGRGAPW